MKKGIEENYWTTFLREFMVQGRFKVEKQMIVLLFCFGIFLLPMQTMAQQFMVDGSLTVEQGELDGALITLKMDKKSPRKLKHSSSSGKFVVDLDYQHYYVFTFSKKGYITKQISINTKCPKSVAKGGMLEPFYFRVELNQKTNNTMVDTAFYNRPVGRIFYSKEFRKFDYDRDYSMAVKRKLDSYRRGDVATEKVEAPAWLADLNQDSKSKKMEADYQEKVKPNPDSRLIAMQAEKESDQTDSSDKELPMADVILNTTEVSEQIEEKQASVGNPKEPVAVVENNVSENATKPVVAKVVKKPVKLSKVNSSNDFPTKIKDKKRVDGREEERVNYPNRVEFRVHLTKNGLTSSYWFSRYNWGSMSYYKKLPSQITVEITREEYEHATK